MRIKSRASTKPARLSTVARRRSRPQNGEQFFGFELGPSSQRGELRVPFPARQGILEEPQTKVFEVAKSRLSDEQTEFRKQKPVAKIPKSGRMTAAIAVNQIVPELEGKIPMRRNGRKSTITDSTAAYRQQTIDALKRTWMECRDRRRF